MMTIEEFFDIIKTFEGDPGSVRILMPSGREREVKGITEDWNPETKTTTLLIEIKP